ncbi:MAG TPA: hypothetical protein VJ717_21075 [Gemmatimonadaceae bacterium]|nr:hypothetical protein [Gemmatimonadaceae bacterium]
MPFPTIALSHGWRLGGEWGWNLDEPNLIGRLGQCVREEAIPFLHRVDTVDDLIATMEDLGWSHVHPGPETVAYGLAKVGRKAEAIAALAELAAWFDRKVEWQRESAERAELLANLML